MLLFWLIGCSEGTPTDPQPPQNPPTVPNSTTEQAAEAPPTRIPAGENEVMRPIPAEERDGENGKIALSTSINCETPRASSAAFFEFKRNSLPDQEVESWRSIDSEEPFGHENGAIAVVDLNADDWDDVVIASATGIFAYLNNSKGGFDLKAEWFSGVKTESITGIAAADYDNDGQNDLYLTQFMAPDLLLKNTGTAFEEAKAGLSSTKTISGGASWMDYDRDGDLDIFVSAHGAGPEGDFSDKPKLAKADKNQLYENTGNKFRSQASKLSYGGKEPYTFNGLWLPLDDEAGWDLFLVNDFGEFVTSNLALSNGSSFKPLKDTGLELKMYATSASMSDWNRDGVPDILVSGIGAPALLMSSEGQWQNQATELGIPENPNRTTTWGAAVFDMDNDGDDDIWMAAGPIFFPENDGVFPNAEKQTDGIFLYDNGSFSEPAWSFSDTRNSRSAVAADLNRDGFWEVIVNPIDGPVDVYWGVCDGSGWIDVRLNDSKGNRAGLGALVEVKAGDASWTKWMTSGAGFGSTAPAELHFGLGSRSQVDSITVTWSDGEQSVFRDVPTKRKVVISR